MSKNIETIKKEFNNDYSVYEESKKYLSNLNGEPIEDYALWFCLFLILIQWFLIICISIIVGVISMPFILFDSLQNWNNNEY